MNDFNRKAARRIAAVSILLAILTSPAAWFISREIAEEEVVSLAMEESRRVLDAVGTSSDARSADELAALAQQAAKTITGGLFDIAEIYDPHGRKLAESATPAGEEIERLLPKHGVPDYTKPSYQSLALPDERWILRIFVPLTVEDRPGQSPIAYFEGVRIIPAWQEAQLLQGALTMALLAAAASLLCGLAIYPFVVRLSADNLRKAEALLNSHLSMMEALGRAVARRDSDTGAHNYRVAWIATRIGEALRLPPHAMQALIVGSFLHDIGKIGIPDAILLKPGRLDDAEMDIMRTHVAQGEAIVEGIGWLDEASAVVSGHHEKWDGSGYPRALRGEEIPLGARIFAIADVFDALCSKRPYKAPLDLSETLAILRDSAGTHFDPAMLDVFLELAPAIHARLVDCDERACRQLLDDKVREHFQISPVSPSHILRPAA